MGEFVDVEKILGDEIYSAWSKNCLFIISSKLKVYSNNLCFLRNFKKIRYPKHIVFNAEYTRAYVSTTENYIYIIDVDNIEIIGRIKIDIDQCMSAHIAQSIELSKFILLDGETKILATAFALCKRLVILYDFETNISKVLYESETEDFELEPILKIDGNVCLIGTECIVMKKELLCREFEIGTDILTAEEIKVYLLLSNNRKQHFLYNYRKLEYLTRDKKYSIIAGKKYFLNIHSTNELIELPITYSYPYFSLNYKYDENLGAITINMGSNVDKVVLIKVKDDKFIGIEVFEGYCDSDFVGDRLFLLSNKHSSRYADYII